MAQGTSSTSIEQLYADIVADLIPYFSDAVLLPNQDIILNSYQIAGQSGDTLRIPLTNTWATETAVVVAEGVGILANGSQSNVAPTAANITVAKYGVATNVTEEALEDGGMNTVRNAVLNRFAGTLSSAVDGAGLLAAFNGSSLTDTGAGSSAASHKVNLVMSPEALAYASKREPTVKMWFNPNTDSHEMRGTVRAGFGVLRGNFINPITANATIGVSDANITAVAKAVANLRQQNAPTMGTGQYVSIIDPSFEFAIQDQILNLGGTGLGSLSDVGNRALLQGLIGQAAGVTFFTSNSLPNANA